MKYQLCIAAIAWTLLFNISSALGETLTRGSAEYRIKAAFIYNFTKFIEWPDHGKREHHPTLCIGILGLDPFGREMDSLSDKMVNGRRIVVKRFRVWNERVEECDMLFISGSVSKQLPEIIHRLGSLPVFTIGDTTGFAERGVILNFFKVGDKIRFEINLRSARTAKLKVSSYLLRLATITEK